MTETTTEYNVWHSQHAAEDDTQSVWHQFVKQNLSDDRLDGLTVLEIGCGRGGLSHYIMTSENRPARIYACDYSAEALTIAQSRFGSDKGVEWRREDIQAITLPNNSVHRIISCETIEHVPHPNRAILELYRVLRPGGILYLTCPNYFNLFGLWCLYRWAIGKPFTEGGQPFVNYILLPRLLRWLSHAGFKIAHYHTTNLVLPMRSPYHFFERRVPGLLKWFGFRSYFILHKPH